MYLRKFTGTESETYSLGNLCTDLFRDAFFFKTQGTIQPGRYCEMFTHREFYNCFYFLRVFSSLFFVLRYCYTY